MVSVNPETFSAFDLTVDKHSGKKNLYAGMVELVDAADSKSAGGNTLRVQVSLPVPE